MVGDLRLEPGHLEQVVEEEVGDFLRQPEAPFLRPFGVTGQRGAKILGFELSFRANPRVDGSEVAQSIRSPRDARWSGRCRSSPGRAVPLRLEHETRRRPY